VEGAAWPRAAPGASAIAAISASAAALPLRAPAA